MNLRIYLRNAAVACVMVVCCIGLMAACLILYAVANSIWGPIIARLLTITALLACVFVGAWFMGD